MFCLKYTYWFYPNARQPYSKTTPNKMSAKKNILQLISCISYTKHVRFCLYQSVSLSPSSLSEECLFSQWVPSLSSHSVLIPISLYYHSITYHQESHPIHWIYNTVWKPPQSLLVRCTAMPWWATDKQESQHASWFFQQGSQHGTVSWTTHYTAALKWSLNGLFTTSNTCSCEVIPSGMMTRSVFMNYQ